MNSLLLKNKLTRLIRKEWPRAIDFTINVKLHNKETDKHYRQGTRYSDMSFTTGGFLTEKYRRFSVFSIDSNHPFIDEAVMYLTFLENEKLKEK